jgi:pSer/pThr/pTyr-binding forkhead associated (FHA) protein
MLKLQFRDRRRESVWLVDQTFSIGKSAKNSLMIDDASINERHVEIVNNNDQLTVTNTSNGAEVLLNGNPVTTTAKLKANDILSLGKIDLELIDPKAMLEQKTSSTASNHSTSWSIFSNASWLDQNRYMIGKKVIIGRDPVCDITLPLDHLSRKHVSLEVKNGQLYIQDLDSSNGTFLNGEKVKQSQVCSGDKIKLDVITFEVSGPSHDPNKTIIRTAPAKNETTEKKSRPTPSRLATKVEKVKSPPSKAKIKASAVTNKKRLASDGKQEWISGNIEAKQKPVNKSNKTAILTTIILVAIIAGAAIAMFA